MLENDQKDIRPFARFNCDPLHVPFYLYWTGASSYYRRLNKLQKYSLTSNFSFITSWTIFTSVASEIRLYILSCYLHRDFDHSETSSFENTSILCQIKSLPNRKSQEKWDRKDPKIPPNKPFLEKSLDNGRRSFKFRRTAASNSSEILCRRPVSIYRTLWLWSDESEQIYSSCPERVSLYRDI